MPFEPGETMEVRLVGDPATSKVTFLGQTYTVINGGLDVKRRPSSEPKDSEKRGLLCRIRLPREAGPNLLTFDDGHGHIEEGLYRVVTGSHRKPKSHAKPQRLKPSTSGIPNTDARSEGVRARRL